MKLKELQQQVTESIAGLIDNGVNPWQSGRRNEYPQNGITGRLFTGFNPFILLAATYHKGYNSNLWLTFNQIKKAGGRLVGEGADRKAGAYILEPRTFDANKKDPDADPRMVTCFVGSARFNADQTDLKLRPETKLCDATTMDDSLAFLRSVGACVDETPDCSCFIPQDDRILITRNDLWDDVSKHYSTCRHELTHWTGHTSRLNRPQLTNDGLAYAFEELIAEIGAAMMCARANVTYSLDNHASYIESWSRVLKGDQTALFRAAEKATKAIGFIDSKSKSKTEIEIERAA